jgi:catechol 2,3-dioxygenase-like lactoylglutathione lyase family enzyme
MLRFDHVGVVVDDLDAAVAFFLALGFEREGGGRVDGEWVDRIVGLDGVQVEIVMVRAPDGSGKLEVIKFHAPADANGVQALPSNRLGLRHVCLEIADLDETVDGLRAKGFDTVGDVQDAGATYRQCYVRGPEGLIVELAEQITARSG